MSILGLFAPSKHVFYLVVNDLSYGYKIFKTRNILRAIFKAYPGADPGIYIGGGAIFLKIGTTFIFFYFLHKFYIANIDFFKFLLFTNFYFLLFSYFLICFYFFKKIYFFQNFDCF